MEVLCIVNGVIVNILANMVRVDFAVVLAQILEYSQQKLLLKRKGDYHAKI